MTFKLRPLHLLAVAAASSSLHPIRIDAFLAGAPARPTTFITTPHVHARPSTESVVAGHSSLWSQSSPDAATVAAEGEEDEAAGYPDAPDDAVIVIKPKAIDRLRELRAKQSDPTAPLVLRMGVRNGGCSGLSYVMDFSTEEEIEEEDAVDEYPEPLGLKCVVDAKSMLYLYGLELDYSDELIGGGFKFFNPNAEESCGCGSSFGV